MMYNEYCKTSYGDMFANPPDLERSKGSKSLSGV